LRPFRRASFIVDDRPTDVPFEKTIRSRRAVRVNGIRSFRQLARANTATCRLVAVAARASFLATPRKYR
jgi:hypothetical protein